MPPPPVEIIAEIANAHQGDPEQAARLADAALDAGADAVKFQIYSADELLVKNHPRYRHFRDQAFSSKTWAEILTPLVRRSARIYCDVFGPDALRIAATADVHGYKVHSSDLANDPLLEKLAALHAPVLLAVGGSTAPEIARAVRVFSPESDAEPSRLVLLHGFQSYPTAVEDASLSRLAWLARHFGPRCQIGYADHAAADDPFAFTLPLMALALGATVIEKHITFDRSARGVDYYSSLEPRQFARFVDTVRAAQGALGHSPESFVPAERKYRTQVKKHWVTTRPLDKEHRLTPQDLVMKRVADHDPQPTNLNLLLGRRLLRDCPAEYPLTRADLSHTVWALVVARMKSSRLPGKALIEIAGVPALGHLLQRLKQAQSLSRIVLCTTTESDDDPLVALAEESGIACHRGPIEDVLGRMVGAMNGHDVDLALRVTGDDILVDPDYLDRAVQHHLRLNAEYSDLKQLPSGTEVEVFDADLLRGIHQAAKDPSGTEYLTFYIDDHRDHFRTNSVPVDPNHARDWPLTLDTPEDLRVLTALLEAMRERGKPLTYRLNDIVAFFNEHLDCLKINARTPQRTAPPKVCTDIDWNRWP